MIYISKKDREQLKETLANPDLFKTPEITKNFDAFELSPKKITEW